jgi:hypothetical protein
MQSNAEDKPRENARQFAKSGAKLGATAGSRVGPVTTGVASGFGGAAGYLMGAAVDGLEATLDAEPSIADGGTRMESDETETTAGIDIPVTGE